MANTTTSKPTTAPRCEHCGRELQPFRANGMTWGLRCCSCQEAQDAALRAEQEREQERMRGERRRWLRKLQRHGIGARYADAVTDMEDGSWYIFGDVGTGKTHAASALAIRALKRGEDVRKVTDVDLMGEIRATYNGDGSTERAVLRKYGGCDLLVIDDLGKAMEGGRPSEHTRRMLWEIVNARYEADLPLIVTTQYSRRELGELLGGDRTALSIVSRLAEMCKAISMTGADRRIGGAA